MVALPGLGDHSITVLGLPQDIEERCKAAQLFSLALVRDCTGPQLIHQADLSEDKCDRLWRALDRWYGERFRGDVLLPQCPVPCYDVALDYLDLPNDLVGKLNAEGIEYFYQLAFSRYSQLKQRYALHEMGQYKAELRIWLETWRSGELSLHEDIT